MRKLLLLLFAWAIFSANSSSDFDGTDDHIDHGTIADLEDETEMTIMGWAIPDNVTADHAVSGNVDGSLNGGYLFQDDSGGVTTDSFRMFVNGAATNSATNTAQSGVWTHSCGTFTAEDASGIKVFIDGAQSGSGGTTVGTTDSGNPSTDWFSGESPGINDDRNGRLAYTLVWNRDLSSTDYEIIENMYKPGMSPENLVIFDPMWKGSATHQDLSGNNNDGTVVNDVSGSVDGPPHVMFGGGLPL